MSKEENLTKGCILISRSLLYSDIWFKPAEYWKIFTHILARVNHSGNKLYQRGENFFNFSEEKIPHVSKNQIYDFLRWAKHPKIAILTTRKTTRGIVVKVNNYNIYQDLANYKFQDKLQHSSNTAPTQLQNNSNTIIKECKNVKNTTTLHSEISEIFLSDLKNWHGEYKNVRLDEVQYSKLLTFTLSEEALSLIIEDLSGKIESGKEDRWNENLPNAHFERLKAYWKYRRLYPQKFNATAGKNNNEEIRANDSNKYKI